MSEPAPSKQNKNNGLTTKKAHQPAPSKQYALDLGIEVQKDVNGIEMGVLENGIPYLTQKGLAGICGIARSVVFDISQEWEDHFDDEIISKDRISFIRDYLFENGYHEKSLYIETKKDGTINNAYPDIVCMAFLEYYAFESKSKNETAIANYRKLAAYGLQKFIFEALNYTPADKWKYHHDRVSILKGGAPDGYFIIFNEINGLIIDLIDAGLIVNEKTIPDISVGMAWSEYWSTNNLEIECGNRIKFAHNYPDYYPQSSSNPQKPWAYPDSSLKDFRFWFKNEYLKTKFPQYILKKANLLQGGKEEAKKIANLYAPLAIK